MSEHGFKEMSLLPRCIPFGSPNSIANSSVHKHYLKDQPPLPFHDASNTKVSTPTTPFSGRTWAANRLMLVLRKFYFNVCSMGIGEQQTLSCVWNRGATSKHELSKGWRGPRYASTLSYYDWGRSPDENDWDLLILLIYIKRLSLHCTYSPLRIYLCRIVSSASIEGDNIDQTVVYRNRSQRLLVTRRIVCL